MKNACGKRIMACALSVICLVGCGDRKVPAETLDDEAIWGNGPEETKGIEVQTEYFTFQYPKDWLNKVEEIHTKEGNNSVTTFQTMISGLDVELFSIILGPDEADAFLLGWLVANDNTVNVYTSVNDMPAEMWTKEEYDEICSLQERINEIIIQFYEDERFVPIR